MQFWGMKMVAVVGNSSGQRALKVIAEVQANVAVFKISGRISQWSESNVEAFEAKVDEIIKQGVTDLDIYLNTEGGSVLVANEIVNQMKRFTGTIRGRGGAIVASSGTYIAVQCHSFTMAKNGLFMIHKPMTYFEGNEDQVEADLKLLKNLTADYKAQYSKKTGISEIEIEALWSKGDYWMNAYEAKSKKFVDSIEGEETITEETTALLKACGAPNIPKITNSKKTMEINPTDIGLPADASSEQVQAKLKDLREKSAEADRFKREQKQKDDQEKSTKVKAKLDAAVLAKKIKADQYSKWQALLESDFEGNGELLDSIPGVEAISKSITGAPEGQEDRSKWTYADWIDKDPEGLNSMRTEKEAEFNKLMDAYYK